MKNIHEHEMTPVFPGYNETYIKLTQNRVIFVSEIVSDTMAAELSALLLYLDNESHSDIIRMYIHSNGGAVTGLSNIYDVMQMIRAPISTICIGKCYSAAAILLAAGSKGERYAMANSSIMIHGIQFGFPIPGHDITSSKSYFDYIKDNNDNIMKILAHHTNHTLEKVKEDCKQDVWMTAKEAQEYGIIDHII